MKNIDIDTDSKEVSDDTKFSGIHKQNYESVEVAFKALLKMTEMGADRSILRKAEDMQWDDMLSWKKTEPKPKATWLKGNRWEWAKSVVGKIHL